MIKLPYLLNFDRSGISAHLPDVILNRSYGDSYRMLARRLIRQIYSCVDLGILQFVYNRLRAADFNIAYYIVGRGLKSRRKPAVAHIGNVQRFFREAGDIHRDDEMLYRIENSDSVGQLCGNLRAV